MDMIEVEVEIKLELEVEDLQGEGCTLRTVSFFSLTRRYMS